MSRRLEIMLMTWFMMLYIQKKNKKHRSRKNSNFFFNLSKCTYMQKKKKAPTSQMLSDFLYSLFLFLWILSSLFLFYQSTFEIWFPDVVGFPSCHILHNKTEKLALTLSQFSVSVGISYRWKAINVFPFSILINLCLFASFWYFCVVD